MKKQLTFSMIAIVAGILLLSTTVWARGHVAQYQRQQMQRIEQGFAKSDPSAKEHRGLVNIQRQIRRAAQRALSDNHLQPAQKHRIDIQLARRGHHNHRERHDRDYRRHGRRHHHDRYHHRCRGRDRHRYCDRDRPRHRYRYRDRHHYHYHYHYRGRPIRPRIVIPLPPPPFWF